MDCTIQIIFLDLGKPSRLYNLKCFYLKKNILNMEGVNRKQ